MRASESSTSYNTKRNTVVARKPTRMDQRAQEGKKAMLLYSQTPLKEEHFQKKPPFTKLK